MSRQGEARTLFTHLLGTLPDKLRGVPPAISDRIEYEDLPLNTELVVGGVAAGRLLVPAAGRSFRDCERDFEVWFHAMITGRGEKARLRDFRTQGRRQLCDFVCDDKSEGDRAARLLHAFALSTGAERVVGDNTFLLSKGGHTFGVQDGALVTPRWRGYVVGHIDVSTTLSRVRLRISDDLAFNVLVARLRRAGLGDDEKALIALRRSWFRQSFMPIVNACSPCSHPGTPELRRLIERAIDGANPNRSLHILLVPHWMTPFDFSRLVGATSCTRYSEEKRERVTDNLFSHFNF